MSAFPETKPWIDEINRLNKKCKHIPDNLSIKDVRRGILLYEKIRKFHEKYDLKNPVDPCPGCNWVRKASEFGGMCTNWDNCALSPKRK